MAWRTVAVRGQKGLNQFQGKGGTGDFPSETHDIHVVVTAWPARTPALSFPAMDAPIRRWLRKRLNEFYRLGARAVCS